MGARAARSFEAGDAGRLIHAGAGRQPRIDMADPERTVVAGVKIGVEHAILPAELQLEARAFTDLERRLAEVREEIGCAHSHDLR